MIQHQALTISEVARRWSVSRERVKAMIDQGKIPGAFALPSAGRFGRTIKVPLSAVQKLEESWLVHTEDMDQAQKPKAEKQLVPRLDHFPELLQATVHDAEYREAEQD